MIRPQPFEHFTGRLSLLLGLRLPLPRQLLRFRNLRGSHAPCDFISIVCYELLRVIPPVFCVGAVPHVCPHIILRRAVSMGIHHPKPEETKRDILYLQTSYRPAGIGRYVTGSEAVLFSGEWTVGVLVCGVG